MTDRHFQPIRIVSALLALICLSCNQTVKMDVQGHRGCRGLFPENSLPAFEKAIDIGVSTLELDVVVSKDLKVVVSHEPYISEVICLNSDGSEITAGSGKLNLFEMEYSQIQKFDCGSKRHPFYPEQKKMKTHKPLLSEVFELVKSKNSEVRFNIEIKSLPEYYGVYTPHPEAYVNIVLGLIKASGMLHRTTLQSFDVNILEETHSNYTEVAIALLVDEKHSIQEVLSRVSFKPDIISPYYKLLDPAQVASYQKRGFSIIPWTVNTKEDLGRVISWGVDGIITDYPDRLLELLKD